MSNDGERAPDGSPPLDARALAVLARGGGDLALAAWRSAQGARSWPIKGERALRAWLAEELARIAPGVSLIPAASRSHRLPQEGYRLAFHSLDGADAFAARIPTWAISLGLLHGHELVAGAVYLPAIGDLYVAADGELRWNDEIVPRGGDETNARLVIAGSELRRRSVLRIGRGKPPAGPTSYHLCLVARGAAEAAVVRRAPLWEIAGGLAALQVAGGGLVDLATGKAIEPSSLLTTVRRSGAMIASLSPERARTLARLRAR